MDDDYRTTEEFDPFDAVRNSYGKQVDVRGADLRDEVRDDFLKRFPEFAQKLRQFFAEEDALRMMAGPQAGSYIGPYQLIQRIGVGGMGTVWSARQFAPIRRTVAVKLVKPGVDTEEVLKRFEAERQALALMDHPSIARILDAGATADGRPYFAMEFVQGVPIVKYCETNEVSLGERLDLMLQVCSAVQHAHQKGVIHRDLKPSNILVTLSDNKAVAKVIDFGLAKALNQDLTPNPVYTEFGQVIGTLDYMPPEQAELSALGIDTRADVYSLGAILYELLTGYRPLDVPKASWQEALRIIKEDEPIRPSRRLSSSTSDLAQLAAQRRMEPHKLLTAYRDDLDWLVLKALEKDRLRRYESVEAFRHELERYINNEPLQVRPQSLLYRFQKFVRRHRISRATMLFIAAALLIGMAVAAIGVTSAILSLLNAKEQMRIAKDEAFRAGRAEKQAVLHAKEATTANHKLERELRVVDARRIMSHSLRIRKERPTASLLLAKQAAESLSSSIGHVPTDIEHELRLALSNVGGVPLPPATGGICVFSGDATRLAINTSPSLVEVYDISQLPQLRRVAAVEVASQNIQCLALNTNGTTLAVGEKNGLLTVWDFEVDGRPPKTRTLVGHRKTERVEKVQFHPGGRWLVSGARMLETGYDDVISSNGDVLLWDLNAQPPAPVTLADYSSQRSLIAFIADGEQLITPSDDKESPDVCRIWNMKGYSTGLPPYAGSLVHRQWKDQFLQPDVAISSNGQWIVVQDADARNDKVYSLVNRAAAESTIYLTNQSEELSPSEMLDPHGKWLLLHNSDRTFRLRDLDSNDEKRLADIRPRSIDAPITCTAFSTDGHWIAIADNAGSIVVWNLHADGEPQARMLNGHDGMIADLKFTSDGTWLVSHEYDGGTRAWNLRESAWVNEPRAVTFNGAVEQARISGDGRWLAAIASADSPASEERALVLCDVSHHPPKQILTPQLDNQRLNTCAKSVSFGHRSRKMAVVLQGNSESQLGIYEIVDETPKLLYQFSMEWFFSDQPLFSPDDQYVIVQDVLGARVSVVNLNNGNMTIQPIRDKHSRVVCVTNADLYVVNYSSVAVDDLNERPTLSVYDLDGHQVRHFTSTLIDEIGQVSVDSTGASGVATINGQCVPVKMDRNGLQQDGQIISTDGFVDAMWLSNNGRWLVTHLSGVDESLRIRDQKHPTSAFDPLITKHHESLWDSAVEVIRGCAFTPDSRRLFAEVRRQGLRMWDLERDRPAAEAMTFAMVGEIAGSKGVIASDETVGVITDNSIWLWRLRPSDLIEASKRACGRTLTALERNEFGLELTP